MSLRFRCNCWRVSACCCHWWSLSETLSSIDYCEESTNGCGCCSVRDTAGYIRSMIFRTFCSSHTGPSCHCPNNHTLSVHSNIICSWYVTIAGNLPFGQYFRRRLVISPMWCAVCSLTRSKRRYSSRSNNILSFPALSSSSQPSPISPLSACSLLSLTSPRSTPILCCRHRSLVCFSSTNRPKFCLQ